MNPITGMVAQPVSSKHIRDCWIKVKEMELQAKKEAEHMQALRFNKMLEELNLLVNEIKAEID